MNSAPTEVEEAVGRLIARMAESAGRDFTYYVTGGMGSDLRLILSDYARLQSESAKDLRRYDSVRETEDRELVPREYGFKSEDAWEDGQ